MPSVVDIGHTVVVGVLSSLVTFVLFYLMTVFALSWGTTSLGFSRTTFLVVQLIGVVFFAITIPISARVAERGRRVTLIWVTAAIAVFGFFFAPLLEAGLTGATVAMVVTVATATGASAAVSWKSSSTDH